MKCVITGSNGFIGTRLREKLSHSGAEVRCLVRSGSGKTKTAAPGDVTTFGIDYGNVESLVDSGALDDAEYVFHVAGVTKSITLDGFRQGNVMPTRNLIEALDKLRPPLKRFVHISSQAAAGPAPSANHPLKESDEPAPVEDYGLSKLEAENLLRQGNLPFDYTIIRPGAVYGPRDVDFLALFKQLKRGLGIYPGNRNGCVSVIHVEDLVEGIMQAAHHVQAKNETYFLVKDVSLGWHQIYSMITDIWGSRLLELNLPFGLIAAAGRLGDLYSKATGQITVLNSKKIDLARPKFWLCSSEKAQHEFGFSPNIDIKQGLQSTFDWYKNAGWLR